MKVCCLSQLKFVRSQNQGKDRFYLPIKGQRNILQLWVWYPKKNVMALQNSEGNLKHAALLWMGLVSDAG
jgi:hypothetical protein